MRVKWTNDISNENYIDCVEIYDKLLRNRDIVWERIFFTFRDDEKFLNLPVMAESEFDLVLVLFDFTNMKADITSARTKLRALVNFPKDFILDINFDLKLIEIAYDKGSELC